jgi:outer membrane protein assembly factor BamD
MFGSRLSVVPLSALCVALTLAGCNTTPIDQTAGWSPNRLYSEATDERNAGAYEKAIALYEKLEGRAAGTPLAQQAQLDKAYAQYKSGEQASAPGQPGHGLCAVPARPGQLQ